MTAGGLQRGLLLALGVSDLVLLAEALGAWEGGRFIPWQSLAEAVSLGMILLAALLTLNWSAWRRRLALALTAAVVVVFAWLRNGGDGLKFYDYREYEWPLHGAYFAATLLGLALLRRAGLHWAYEVPERAKPPQIGLRSILILTSVAACGLALAGMLRRKLDAVELEFAAPYAARIAIPFNGAGWGVIWLQVLAVNLGLLAAVVSFGTLLVVARRGGPILRLIAAGLVIAAAGGLVAYAWRLDHQWHYLLIEAGFLAGFVGINLALVRAAGYTLEKQPKAA